MKKLSYQDVKDKIVRINHQNVILDYAVAELYGVQTKEINQAVKNNPKKFPPGYIISLSEEDLRSKILTANSKSRVTPKAFTEK